MQSDARLRRKEKDGENMINKSAVAAGAQHRLRQGANENAMTSKLCSVCLEMFKYCKDTDGILSQCKSCRKSANRQTHAEKRDESKAKCRKRGRSDEEEEDDEGDETEGRSKVKVKGKIEKGAQRVKSRRRGTTPALIIPCNNPIHLLFFKSNFCHFGTYRSPA
jgi:hypothetical protein